jgi:PAS domain S-box-containing protein
MALADDFEDSSLDAVLRTALDAVVVMRIDGTIAGWNDIAVETFGWKFSDVRDQRMSEFIIPLRYRKAHELGLSHYLATGEGPVLDRHIEIEALHRDGREIPVELSITRTSQFGETVFLGFLRDITERRATAQRQALLIGELNHRGKNLLAVVAGIAHQTIRAATSLGEFEAAFTGRLASLGQAHDLLTAANWERAPLGELAAALLGPYLDDGRASVIVGPEVMLEPRQFLSLSMILHELVTNAVKYGALATMAGRVSLGWDRQDEEVIVDWVETSATAIAPPTQQGFGTKMIKLSVEHELKGKSTYEWRPDGLRFGLRFRRV